MTLEFKFKVIFHSRTLGGLFVAALESALEVQCLNAKEIEQEISAYFSNSPITRVKIEALKVTSIFAYLT